MDITSDMELREEITKVYVAWYMATKKTYKVKWGGSFMELMKCRKEDKKVIPEVLQKKWEETDEILDSDLPKDFTKMTYSRCCLNCGDCGTAGVVVDFLGVKTPCKPFMG